MHERTHKQALSRIVELEAEIAALNNEVYELTVDRDEWRNLVDERDTDLEEVAADCALYERSYDEAAAELEELRYKVTTTECVAPVADRAASIRGALDAIPAELKRDPRYQYDFQTLNQLVYELAG